MHRGIITLLVVGALAATAPATALAGTYTLNPNGFGTHTYASWKAGEGLPDSSGDSQALYFQKHTLTATPVAAVARISGFEGLAGDELTGLEWEHRTDGHCGGGAPRWNARFTNASGQGYTVFLGCAAALHTPGSGPEWIRDTYSNAAIALQVLIQTGQDLSDLTLTGLSIVFDEGTDSGPGHVYLDNIRVNDHTWTYAGDNGN